MTLCQNLKIKSSTDRLLLPMTSGHTNQSCNLILSTIWYLKRWQGSVNNTFSWPKCQAGLGVALAAYGTLMISGHERNQKSSSSHFICSDFFLQFLLIFLLVISKWWEKGLYKSADWTDKNEEKNILVFMLVFTLII